MGALYDFSTQGVSVYHSVDEHPLQRRFSMHVHAQNEILVFVSGSATYLVEGNEYPLVPGSILFMRDAESHAINVTSDEPYERFVINFSPSFIADADPERRLLAPFYDRPLGVGNLYTPSELSGLFVMPLLKAMCEPSGDVEEKRLAALSNLLPLLHGILHAFRARRGISEQSESDLLSARIISHINENLLSPITVPDVAKHFYMSVSQLERTFKQATHSSVWHYVTAKRLAAARARIENGASATVASAECGFGDYSSFYRAYLKQYGESPTSLKKKL